MTRCIAAVLSAWLIFAAIGAGAQEITRFKEYKYWESGKIRECNIYDSSGKLLAKAWYLEDGTIEKTERYDKLGNRIEAAFYDGKNRLKKGVDGWAAMRWWYDEDSQIVSQISYDENGRPVERKRYSSAGNLIDRQRIDDGSVGPYEDAAMAMLLQEYHARQQR